MCLKEIFPCFKPETEEGPALRSTVSGIQHPPPETKGTKDGGVDDKQDIISQPKANAANGAAVGARSYPKSTNGNSNVTPKSNDSSNEKKETDSTHKRDANRVIAASPEESEARALTKTLETNEPAKIPPKNIASYEVLTPKDQIKAAGYDKDRDGGESMGRRPQRKNIGTEGAAGFKGEA